MRWRCGRGGLRTRDIAKERAGATCLEAAAVSVPCSSRGAKVRWRLARLSHEVEVLGIAC